jgi:hypothetical protein
MLYSVTNTYTPRLEQVTSGRATLAGMGGLVLGLVTSNTIPLKDPKIAESVTLGSSVISKSTSKSVLGILTLLDNPWSILSKEVAT